MMISTKGRYALRLMIDIASREQDGSPVTMRQAAERENLSVKYLEQLGGALVKAGVLKSIRGVCGGYLLARPAEDILAGDILRATEGSCAPVSCLEDGADACPRRDECVAINFWRGLDKAIEDYVDGVTLADLVAMA
ncbi:MULTISPECIES: RrF2 family transcriptional regulator [Gordonibacter]|uniref:Rrf2 family transcriptional regulator n=1 Tax=Gordonibacter faecis TaxID=3047475 RepID=A0ABT7DLQ3_9ACTN|nr:MULTISPECIES: Rrf2 family transcriptional regulator [unclassified Gordonibacter]MDJ1650469.1 Rrf2 family transcriptional regulator [Gordonibacter sp. KGMB12511]HIW77395.1 Rrf2 family transcriptional regulator [Candidatus Gordonibacter avicola]